MRELFLNLWRWSNKSDKYRFMMVIALTIVSSFLEVISIGMTIPLVTALINPESLINFSILKDIFKNFGLANMEEIVHIIILVFIAVTIISAVIRILSIKMSAEFAFSLGNDLSVRVYENILKRPYVIHKDINSSTDVSKLISKINTIIQSLIFPSIMLMSALFMFVIIATIFLFVNFLITLIVLTGVVCIYLMVTWYFKKRLKDNSEVINSMYDEHVKAIQEGVGNIQDTILNNTFEYFISLYRDIDKKLRMRQASNIVISQAPKYIIESISVIFLIAFAYYLVFLSQSISKEMFLPVFLTIAIAMQRMLPIAQQAYRSWANISGNKKSLQEIMSLTTKIDDFLEITEKQDIVFNNSIELINVSFKYPSSDHFSLQGVNLKIKKGQRIGFIGSTGCGKSTIIDLIMGLLVPDNGEIKVDGTILKACNSASWYKHITHVPQNIFLLDGTIYENIATGDRVTSTNKVKIESAGKLACLDEFLSLKSQGYSLNVGERGSKLSGGQKQRVGLARCIYKKADLIVLDESTSALDSELEKEVMNNIYNLDQSHTILIIAHRLDTLRGCDQIVKLSKGRIKRVGNYDEILGGVL